MANKKTVEYQYKTRLNNQMTYARVFLEISPNSLNEDRIEIADKKKFEFKSQGNIDSGWKIWNQSAKEALVIALKELDNSIKYDILIIKLEGRILLDTNNAAIGVACILALMIFLKIQLDDEMLNKMNLFVREDWDNDQDSIPDFQRLYDIES